MSTHTEILIGRDHCTTARAKEQKLYDAAEEALPDTFDLLRTKPGIDELENVYNIALQIKYLKHKIQLYDMAD
eukprot:8169817-Ditylum_brightwellii.AAC.1